MEEREREEAHRVQRNQKCNEMGMDSGSHTDV